MNGFVYTGPNSPIGPYPLLEGNKKLVASFTRDSAGNASIQTIDIKRTTQDVVFAPARYEPGAPVVGVQTGYGIADSPISYEAINILDDVFNVPRPVAFLSRSRPTIQRCNGIAGFPGFAIARIVRLSNISGSGLPQEYRNPHVDRRAGTEAPIILHREYKVRRLHDFL